MVIWSVIPGVSSPVSFFGYLQADQAASDLFDPVPWYEEEANDFPHNDGDDFIEIPEDGMYIIMLTGTLDNTAATQAVQGELRRRQ